MTALAEQGICSAPAALQYWCLPISCNGCCLQICPALLPVALPPPLQSHICTQTPVLSAQMPLNLSCLCMTVTAQVTHDLAVYLILQKVQKAQRQEP